jgi:hypothetical protein
MTSNKIQVGAALAGQHFWIGYIRALVIGPQSMSAETWRAIVAIREGAPNPYDEDALAHELSVLRTMLTAHEPVLLEHPTERELFTYGTS